MQVVRGGAQLSFEVTDAGHVGACRRAAQKMAEVWQLNGTCVGQVGIVAAELATNLVKHAKGGELLIQPIHDDDICQIELLAIDRGPGMARVADCIQDGYSTTGTAGTGFGAVKRLASVFDAYSQPGTGSIVLARVAEATANSKAPLRRSSQLGMISLPMRGEFECGDTWSVAHSLSTTSLLVVDGLGHGPLAAVAATTAASAYAESPFNSPQETMHTLHRRLGGTRGAAAACALCDDESSTLSYAGIGNIAGCIVSAGVQTGLLSHNGTLGLVLSRSQSITYDWPVQALLVMHSDGLSARWSLADYPGLTERHPAVIAAALVRDFSRGRDDSTVVVARRLQ
ncbi:MAG TPA: SpoIIE family protein phosphatase [Terriglobales bacterium]|nr:SpoIIE family protein phosphatase [Terriglobales bacterium]